MLTGQDVEAGRGHPLAEEERVLAQLPAQASRICQQVEYLERCRDDGRRHGIREQIRAGTLAQQFHDLPAPTGVTAAGAAQRLSQRAGQNVHALPDREQFWRAASVLADKAYRVRVVHHHHGLIPIRQVADTVKLGDIAIHGKDAVGSNQAMARRLRLLQLRLQILHVAVAIAQARSFAQTDAVDDAGMVQLVGNDGVLGLQQRFKQAAVGVEAGTVEEGVFAAQERAQTLFQLLVQRLRAADEAHAGQPIAPLIESLPRRRDHDGMIGQAQIIVRAQVENRGAACDLDPCLLRPADHALPLVQPAGGDRLDPGL